MSRSTTSADSSTGTRDTTRSGSSSSDVHHTREDALTDLEFELLIDASYDLDYAQDLETRLALLLTGRLGLRRGELTHMQESWIDWRKERIEIPAHEPCRKGRDGGLCAHCKQMARQQVDGHLYNAAATMARVNRKLEHTGIRFEMFELDIKKAAERLDKDTTVDDLVELTEGIHEQAVAQDVLDDACRDPLLEELLDRRWEPKTERASRAVPYRFSGRVAIAIDRYFSEWDQWMYSGQSINRRLNWVADMVDGIGRVTPHVLRATAATYHVGRGLKVLPLQSMFGWANSHTAEAYVASSADNLDRQLQFTHS